MRIRIISLDLKGCERRFDDINPFAVDDSNYPEIRFKNNLGTREVKLIVPEGYYIVKDL